MALSLGVNGFQFLNRKEAESGITVLGVLDGDTITLEGKTRFRLRNIDAPELNFCGGAEAKAALEQLIGNNKISVKEETIDQWGRPMGLIYIGERLINEEMIKGGWVRYHSDSTSVAKSLKIEADQIKAEKKGVYGEKCYQTENKAKPDCTIKGNIDMNDNKIKRYFVPGCVQYKTAIVELDRGEQWFCSEKEAKAAGYVKSERCP